MVLPPELHIYAENILRRFPEEFMALGAPNLEEIYDLRPNGTWSKKMVESSSEKTIEITMRRWSAGNPYAAPAPYPMPYGMNVAPAPQASWSAAAAAARYTQGVMGMPGMPPSMPVNTAPTNTSQAMDEQANQRLGRLESALLALKPQIEAMVTIQSKQLTAPATSNSIPAARGLPLTGSLTPSAEKGEDAPELRLRRNLDKLQINTAPGDKAGGRQPQAAQVATAPPVVHKEPVPSANHQADSEVKAEVEKATKSAKVSRPTVEIPMRSPNEIPLRSSTDPQSPRSPGRFSAWK